MFVTPLNARRNKIFQSIVETHIETASPVSSQTIAQRFRYQISAATVRNVMSQLDEFGLIWQPHTSAGRIPTDKGYRYYIDSLLQPEELTAQEKELIEGQYPVQRETFDERLEESLHILSNFSRYTTLAFSSLGKTRLYFEKVSYILEQPEFRSTQKLQAILRTLEREEPLLSIMREALSTEGVRVHIGKENPCQDIQDCSLVLSNFKIKNRNLGAIGIIGPCRMLYAKTISAVSYMAQILNERMSDFWL